MENMKVEIISKEFIKPSSPTPTELKYFKLSLLDQVAPSSYTPLVFFYPATATAEADHRHRCYRLKKSLAQTLTRYYPFAGTLAETYLVECDDEGVEFSEAQISCKLSEVMEKPDVQILQKLLPFDPYAALSEVGVKDYVFAVRYNVFECGGIALSVCITHKIVDGTSSTTFAKDWAAACRGVTEFMPPSFDSVKLFRPIETRGSKRSSRMDKTVTRRFVFDKASIAALKKQVDSGDFLYERPPSRVETVSAFLWKRFMALARSRETKAKRFAVLHAVNLRGRMEPPLPSHSFGNLWWFAIAEAPIKEEKDYSFLVTEIRKAIKGVDEDYVKTLQNVEEAMKLKMKLGQLVYSGEVEMCSFSSWCRFPIYEADFGWGKPAWFCSPGRPYKNVVGLVDASDGEGIEAWVNLDEKDMPSFESDPEVLYYTSS